MAKTILITLIIGLSIGYWYARQSQPSFLNSLPVPPEAVALQGDFGQQWATLAGRTSALGEHAKNVLSGTVQVNEEQPSFQEKAIEYGQYLYCKQVVTEYETRVSN